MSSAPWLRELAATPAGTGNSRDPPRQTFAMIGIWEKARAAGAWR